MLDMDDDVCAAVSADLRKFTNYKLRVAASTAVGESALSEEDDVFAVTLEDGTDTHSISSTSFPMPAFPSLTLSSAW